MKTATKISQSFSFQHYYAGSQRIATKIGEGLTESLIHITNDIVFPVVEEYETMLVV